MEDIRLVSPPPENSSGIGKYSDTLAEELAAEKTVTRSYIPAELTRPTQFARTAIAAGRASEDVVHIQFDYVLFGRYSSMSLVFFPILLVLKRLYGTPVVVTMHEALNPELVGEPFPRLKKLYVTLVNQSISRSADRIIFMSEKTEDLFERYGNGEQRCRVPHGVPSEKPMTCTQAEAKAAFSYEEEDTLIVEPGYVDPRKGSHVFKEIAALMPEFEFLIAGGSPRAKHDDYAAEIVAEAPPNLQLTGVLNDEEFHLAFQAADLAVLPYQELYQSGVKNTVAQSGVFNLCVAYGLPVVATSCQYFLDLEAEWGCVRTFDDVEEATNIISTIHGDHDDIKKNLVDGLERFRKQNNYNKAIDKHLNIYNSIVE